MTIRFEMNENKVIEVLSWLANEQPGIGAFHVSKVLYYADKEHLNLYGRPVLGDTYIRMEFGPVPSKTYDLIKKENLELSVTQEIQGSRRCPWRLSAFASPAGAEHGDAFTDGYRMPEECAEKIRNS